MNDFSRLGVSTALVEVLAKHGITTPTAIQEKTIRLIKNGKNIIAKAQTGTGKTLAFLLPMFENMSVDQNYVQALIVTPTRELAIQITNEAEKLTEAKPLNILAVYGGKSIDSQLHKLKGNVQLVIGTPGRLLDHIIRGTINFNHLNTLVLDEADQMLHMGFLSEVETIIAQSPKRKQSLCFSATMGNHVKKLAQKIMQNPLYISVENERVTLENIEQLVIETVEENKYNDLKSVIDSHSPFMAIIFCGTKKRAMKLDEDLHREGYNCEALHGDLSQVKREAIMKRFRSAKTQFLVATDLAARGLDIDGVTHVYSYDIADSTKWYIHRIGRTGRAGKQGVAVTFVTPKDSINLSNIEKDIEFDIPSRKISVSGVPQPKSLRRKKTALKEVDEKEPKKRLNKKPYKRNKTDKPKKSKTRRSKNKSSKKPGKKR